MWVMANVYFAKAPDTLWNILTDNDRYFKSWSRNQISWWALLIYDAMMRGLIWFIVHDFSSAMIINKECESTTLTFSFWKYS